METAENLCLGFRLLEERNFAKVSCGVNNAMISYMPTISALSQNLPFVRYPFLNLLFPL